MKDFTKKRQAILCFITLFATTAIMAQSYMTLTSSNEIGERVNFYAKAAEQQSDVWIDLNNNGIREDGEEVTNNNGFFSGELGSQTITIYGDVYHFESRYYSNNFTHLDISHNTVLTHLDCSYSHLTSLDLSNNTALTYLSCFSNKLTSLDVSNNTALTHLSCAFNELTNLDVSHNTALTGLWCYANHLTSLDVSNNTALTSLSCHYNQLTGLDVSLNTELIKLQCYLNQLISLDVSNNTALTYLKCQENQLISLNVANGNNNNVTLFKADDNPDLECIRVDLGFTPPNFWEKDDTASWRNDGGNCTMGVDDYELEALSVYPNPASDVLYISHQELVESYVIYNSMGAKVMEDKNLNINHINIAQLPKGIYFLRIKDKTFKFIKK